MKIGYNPNDYEFEIFSVNSTWRIDSPGVRITNKLTGNRISVTECRTQEENKTLGLLLLYIWEEFGVQADRKDDMGYNYYGVKYESRR